MLFNSYEFVLVFLPVTLLGFYMLGPRRPQLAIGWTVLCSLFFYAYWRPPTCCCSSRASRSTTSSAAA
jgi:hypothetical protein